MFQSHIRERFFATLRMTTAKLVNDRKLPSKAVKIISIMNDYDHRTIEHKWLKKWRQSKAFSQDLSRSSHPFYNLMMFPYPSAEGLHVGNMYAFTGSDIYGRMKRMQGKDVFEPIGLDGFGIHSENYAIRVNRNPKEQAKISRKNFYRQLEATGNAYDWERTLETYDPNYYKWTQWIFIQLFKKGLAYRAKSPVNFCPSCKTVLADEQVVNRKQGTGNRLQEMAIGVCERCGTPVEKKELEQWFFRITKYADRLLEGLEKIDWSERVKIAQRNWIGKKEGIAIRYQVAGSRLQVECWTSRPDTNFGATFIVLAPEYAQVLELTKPESRLEVEKYIKVSQSMTLEARVVDTREKTGAFTGSYAVNNLTGEKMPVWVSDFVLMDFGTGAVVGVPGHDKRDFEFAAEFKIPIKRVVVGRDGDKSPITKIGQVQEEEGTMINSQFLNGLDTYVAKEKIMDHLEKKGWGERKTTYHLRDWLISRQRYWGPPIPVIYCVNCWKVKSEKGRGKSLEGRDYAVIDGREYAIVPVPEDDLPVLLPDVADWRPTGTGKSPLASVEKFVNAVCPECGSTARRETDVSDTFLDSAWYFLRYTSTDDSKRPWSPEIVKKWLPVDMYIGGAEHSVLHLLYTRFLWKVFYDLGYFDFSAKGRPASGWEEPFVKFRAHGLLISEGAKMSKSKGNIVNPDDYIEKYGADTLRCYLMFCGRYLQGGDFRDEGIEGISRFLRRVWRLIQENFKFQISNLKLSGESARIMHQTIKQVTEDIESLDYNTAISALMIWLNFLEKKVVSSSEIIDHSTLKNNNKKLRTMNYELITREELETFLLLLAPFAPFIAEELWSQINPKSKSIHFEDWPKFDDKLIRTQEIQLVVQVNGKVRDIVRAKRGIPASEAQTLALKSEKVQRHIDSRSYKTIFVNDKLINFVLR